MAAPQSNNPLAAFGKLTELRQRLLFVVGALVVFRLGSFIPVPGVNPEAMTRMIEQGGVRVNGEKVTDKAMKLGAGATYVLQVGKRKFAKVALRRAAGEIFGAPCHRARKLRIMRGSADRTDSRRYSSAGRHRSLTSYSR